MRPLFLFFSSLFFLLFLFLFLFFFFDLVLLFFPIFLVFLSNMFYCWHEYQSVTVSSVVGAPWRCGVLTTQGGIAGIGLARLLGESMVQLPRVGGGSSPVKTEPLQIVLLLFWTRV